jgi:Zn-dependent protease with chaperone function
MIRQRPSRSVPVLVLLALCLLAPPWGAGPVFAAAAPAPAAVEAAPRARAGAPSDSARRAYRRWLRHLERVARLDSIARADSVARADSAARAAAPPPAGAPASPAGAPASPAAAPPGPQRSAYEAAVLANYTDENRAYATTRVALGFLGPVYAILVGLFFLFSGLSAWIAEGARRVSRRGYVQVMIFLAVYLAIDFVLGFPLAFYQGHALEHQYRLATQGFGPWLLDQGKGLVIGFVLLAVVPLVWLAYQPVRRFPRHWWLVLGLGTLPVFLAGALLQPLVIDPAFNRFTRLEDKRLEAQVLEVAARAGIPARNVFQSDASKQTVKYNAYVSGFGVSQRIVLWDTTLEGMRPDEILFVVAHEAGHYRLHHMWWGILFMTGMSFVVFGLAAALMRGAVRRWGGRWGFRELHDVASVPLFIVTLTLLATLAQPAVNAFSRRIERDSDTFALELTRANDAGARAFMKLGSQNRSDPDPPAVIEFLSYSHPPLLDRVRYALSYRPWAEGRPNRLFRPKD